MSKASRHWVIAVGLLAVASAATRSAGPGCRAESNTDSAMPVEEAHRRFDQANTDLDAGRFPSGIQALESIGWAPNAQIRTGIDLQLSQAIWLTLARSYFNAPATQYCNSARHFGYLLIDGHTDPKVADEIELVLQTWDAVTKPDREDFLDTLLVLGRLVDQHLGRAIAQRMLRNLAKTTSSKETRRVLEDLAIELYATGYWPVHDFELSEKEEIAKFMRDNPGKNWGLWGDICHAFGFDDACEKPRLLVDPQPLDALSKVNRVDDVFKVIGASVIQDYDSSVSIRNVVRYRFGAARNERRRSRLFSTLLSSIARNLSAESKANSQQAFYRWKAAYFLEPNDLSTARFAASLIGEQPDLDEGFKFAGKLIDNLKLREADTLPFFLRFFSLNPNSTSARVVSTSDLAAIFQSLVNARYEPARREQEKLKNSNNKLMDGSPASLGKTQVIAPYEGDEFLHGTMAGKHAGLIVSVSVWHTDSCDGVVLPPLWTRVQEATRYLDENQEAYVVPLSSPLDAGQCVRVSWPDSSGKLIAQTVPVETGTRGWARSRLYGRIGAEVFPGGVVRGASAAFFGSLGYDFAFRAETLRPEFAHKSKLPLGLHGYLEGRLESVSVAVHVTSESVESDQKLAERCGQRNTCSGSPIRGRSGEAGLYAPWMIPGTSRYYTDSGVGWFVAPLIKVGTQGRVGDQPPPGTVIPLLVGGVPLKGEELRSAPFSYEAAGVRVGQFRYFFTRSGKRYFLGQIAPTLLANIDFTMGHWQAFTLPPYDHIATLPWRRELRANFSVPLLPLFFGFFLNNGAGANDFRIFVGARYEFAQLLERIRRTHLRR
jgi:hypothetical protein